MTEKHSIKARSHILHLLGDELIGDDRLAVFELVKNGYDADANEVIVLLNLEDKKPNIVVEDNGTGMSGDDITNKWLVLATDSRRGKGKIRSLKYERLPLGEKGIGRLASFKLGNKIVLHTRSKGKPEIKVDINLYDLINSGHYLD